MREQRGRNRLTENLITGAVMLLTWLIVRQLAPEMENRWSMLIALLAGVAASAVIYLVRKKKKEKEEEEKLPPV